MGIGTADETAFAFDGHWRAFLPIALTNTLLTFATLGFYRFWATTRERRYLWSRTRFIDDSLEWTGTGLELFFGFLLALALFGVPFFILNLILQGLILQGYPVVAGTLIVIFYVLLFYLIGVAIFRGLRYRLSRTSWHGIHGGSDDQGLGYGWSYLWKNVVAYLCLALLFPWSMTSLWKERWEKMSFGPHRFVSNPNWSPLMKRYLLAWFSPWVVILGLVVLGGAIAAGVIAAGGAGSGAGEPPSPGFIAAIAILFVAGIYIIIPLVALIYYSKYMREVIGTMSLSSLEFEFTARTKAWIKLFLGNAGLWLIALLLASIPIGALGLFNQFATLEAGEDPFLNNPLAFIGLLIALAIPFALVGPFVRYRNWHFFIRHLEAAGEIDLAQLTQSTTSQMRQGEGLLDAFDMGAV